MREEGKWMGKVPSWRRNVQLLAVDDGGCKEAERCFIEAMAYCPTNVHIKTLYLHYLTLHHPNHRPHSYLSNLFTSILSLDPPNQHGPLIWSRYLRTNPGGSDTKLSIQVLKNATKQKEVSSAVLQDYFTVKIEEGADHNEIQSIFESNLPRVHGRNYVEFVLLYVRYCYSTGRTSEGEEWLDKASSVESRMGTDWVGVERRKRRPRTPGQVVETSEGLMGRIKELSLCDVVHDSSLLLAWAKVKEEDGNVKDAIDILEVAREKFDTDVKVWLALGRIWERKDREKALTFYKESLLMGSGVEGLVKCAKLSKGESSKISYYSRALELGLNDGSVYNAYGNYLTRKGRVKEAGEIYKKGLRVCTRDRQSLYHGHAKLLIKEGKMDEAKNILEVGIKERKEEIAKDVVEGRMVPSRGEAFLRHTLGMLLLKEGEVVKAKKVFEEGLLEEGVGGAARSRLELGAALCSVRLGDEEQSRSYFDKSITSDPMHGHAWQAWSIMEIKADNLAVAKTLVECGLKNCPEHGALWQVYASLVNRQGNAGQAKRILVRGIERCRNHTPLYVEYAMLAIKGEEDEKGGGLEIARKLLKSAMKIDPNGNVWCAAFRVEEIGGTADSCRKILEDGLESTKGQGGKDRVKLLQVSGDFYTKYGRYDRARELFSEGLSLNDADPKIFHSWAQMEAMLFNLDGLNELNKRAVKIFSADALKPRVTDLSSQKQRRKNVKKLPPRLVKIRKRYGGDIDLDLDGDSSISELLELEDDL